MFRKFLLPGIFLFIISPLAAEPLDIEGFLPKIATLEKTGGIRKTLLQAVIFFDQSKISIRKSPAAAPVSVLLSSVETRSLTDLFSVIPFETMEKSYPCKRCRDTFHYKLLVSDEDEKYTVSWDDHGMAPKELFDLGRVLDRLILDCLRFSQAVPDSNR